MSIMDSTLYGDFAKMVYETYARLLPYLSYEIRPEVRKDDWMVRDENGKLIRANTSEEIVDSIINRYIESSLYAHRDRLEIVRIQKETNSDVKKALTIYEVTEL